jgi:cell division protein FtsZ
LTVVRTGTDNAPLILGQEGTHTSVIRTARNSHNVVEAMRENGVDLYDIPAFLRKQAD